MAQPHVSFNNVLLLKVTHRYLDVVYEWMGFPLLPRVLYGEGLLVFERHDCMCFFFWCDVSSLVVILCLVRHFQLSENVSLAGSLMTFFAAMLSSHSLYIILCISFFVFHSLYFFLCISIFVFPS